MASNAEGLGKTQATAASAAEPSFAGGPRL